MRLGTRFAVGAAVAAAAVFGAASPAMATTGPDLHVTAALDQTTYHLGDPVSVTFTLVNNGDATLHNVQPAGGESTGLDFVSPPAFGFDVDPGTPVSITYTYTVADTGVNLGFIAVDTGFGGNEPDANPADGTGVAKARVLGATGVSEGRVYDAAGSDPTTAPGVAGATIKLTNTLDATVTATGTSDAAGAFHIADVPTGVYKVEVTPPSGWELTAPAGPAQVVRDDKLEQFIGLKRLPVPTTTSAAAAPQLPATGTPVGLIAGVGGGVVALGFVLLALARHRRANS